jgi:arylformamidase
MDLIDISIAISPKSISWPGSKKPKLHKTMSLDEGDEANVTDIQMGLHTCTHYDAPLHFISDGHTMEGYPIDLFVGECFVADVRVGSHITKEVLETLHLEKPIRRLLLRANDTLIPEATEFNKNYFAISRSGAEWIVENKIELVGIDYLSVEAFDNKEFETHRTLLGNGVAALEGLNLKDVKQGYYNLIAPPLKISLVEASPARAFLQRI